MQQWLLIFTIILLTGCEGVGKTALDRGVDSESKTFIIDTLATGFQNPWGLEFLPDGRILIVERPGRMQIYQNNRLLGTPVADLPSVWAHGQGGLLDVVLHPDYEQNGWLYLAHSMIGAGNRGNLAISRARLEGTRLVDIETIFHGEPFTTGRVHFGTRLVFDDDGYLYFSIGDRGQPDLAQQLDNHNGKVLRIHDDGSIPADNPFTDKPGTRPEIWVYGSRNIQGMALHPKTRELWSHEHGPRGGDEINIIRKGQNYGWPKATHGINYNGSIISEHNSLPGMKDPVLVWTPSIAPCGMDFITSEHFPGWEDNILVGALAGQHIQRVVLEGEKVIHTEKLLEGMARFRAVRQGPDGYIYILTESPGMFLRLRPANVGN